MSSILPAVWAYCAAGFSLLPLRGKVPVIRWRPYQQRRPTYTEVQNWIDAGLFSNVGIVCGAVSGNLVVFDFAAIPIMAEGLTKAGEMVV